MNKEMEAMGILQEECAEVIQIVSKCRRFGLDEKHLKSGVTNRDRLTEEIGDVLALIGVLIEQEVVFEDDLEEAYFAKIEKLKKWSNLYE